MGRRQAIVRGIGDGSSRLLEEKTANTARQAAKKTNQRHHVALQAERLGKTCDGEWRMGVDAMVAGGTDFLHGMNELLRIAELTHHAVYMGALQHYFLSSDVSATSSRISAMEIAGRTRTNRKIRVTNMPMVPMKVAQSQNVGL